MSRQAQKAFDAQAMFWNDEDLSSGWTITTKNSASVDLEGIDMNPANPPVVQINFQNCTSGGSATIQLGLEDSADDSSFADVTPGPNLGGDIAYDSAELKNVQFALPGTGLRRYVRLTAQVKTAVLTGGTLNAGLV